MIQLNILSGKMAGRQWVARHFPVRIGRAKSCDLCLEEDGVWDVHANLIFEPASGVLLKGEPDALVAVNAQPIQSVKLRNGDAIHIGSVRLQFWMAETRQRGLGLREGLVWALVAGISAAEIAAVYLLL